MSLLKKVVSVTLAGALFFAPLSSLSFAVSEYPGADKLKEFGFVAGDEHGDLKVMQPLNRAQLCVLMAQMYGESDESKNFPYDETSKNAFTDVKNDDWYAPYVGYARLRGWIAGKPDGSFDPTGPVSAQSLATVLLQALDQFDSWATAVPDLNNLGVKIYGKDMLKLNRGEAFDAMWATVNKPRKGKQESLGVEIGKLKPKRSEVTKVDVPSLKMVDIYVSARLEPNMAEDPKNYEFLVDNESVKIERLLYDEEEQKITVIFKDMVKENATLVFASTDVRMVDGDVLDIGEFEKIVMIDKIMPEVVSVESLGTKAIKVVFSEPVKSKDSKLDKNDFVFSDKLRAKNIALYDGDTVAIIELNNSKTGSVTVYPQKSIKDYAGMPLSSGEYEVTMVSASTPLQIDDVISAKPTEVVLELNRGILSASSSETMYKANDRRSDGDPEVKHDRITIKFTKNYLKVGINVIEIAKGALRDYSGNSNGNLSYKVEIEEDNDIPYSEKGVEFKTQNQIKITFNEMLQSSGTSLLSKSNYQLTKDGEDVSKLIKTVTYDSETYTIYITFRENLLGEYRLEILKLLDLSKNDGATYFDFHIEDISAPNPENWHAKAYNVKGKDQRISIRFDEPMMTQGANSVLSPANYMIGGVSLSNLNKDLLEMSINDEGTVVEIKYPGKKYDGIDFKLGNEKDFIVARVSDVSGNLTKGFVNYLSIENANGMTVDSAEMVDGNIIKLTVYENIEELDLNDIIVTAGDKRVYFDVDVEYQDGKTTILLTFDNALSTPVFVKTVKGGTRSVYGEPFANVSKISVEDKLGPKLLKKDDHDDVTYYKGSRTVILRFNEEIDERTVSMLSFELPGIGIKDITVSGTTLKILVADEDKNNVEEGQIVEQKIEIRDKHGNSVTDIVTEVYDLR